MGLCYGYVNRRIGPNDGGRIMSLYIGKDPNEVLKKLVVGKITKTTLLAILVLVALIVTTAYLLVKTEALVFSIYIILSLYLEIMLLNIEYIINNAVMNYSSILKDEVAIDIAKKNLEKMAIFKLIKAIKLIRYLLLAIVLTTLIFNR